MGYQAEGALAQVTDSLARRPLTKFYDRSRGGDRPARLRRPSAAGRRSGVLEPLHPEHNDQDYDSGPRRGNTSTRRPDGEDSELAAGDNAGRNRADLQRYADDLRKRTGFTYTVLNTASRDMMGYVRFHCPKRLRRPCAAPGYGRATRGWTRRSGAS